MTPILRRLNKKYKNLFQIQDENPAKWRISNNFSDSNIHCYRQLINDISTLESEYTILGQYLVEYLFPAKIKLDSQQRICNEDLAKINPQQAIEYLTTALLFNQLLEPIYQHYLLVPRKVEELRSQRKKYLEVLRSLDTNFNAWQDASRWVHKHSISNQVQAKTLKLNLYRLFFVRLKRFFDMILRFPRVAGWYRNWVFNFDKYTDWMLPHIGWFFYLPRLLLNLFFSFKHLIPGFWMRPHEESMGWQLRLNAQLKQRWFELTNDTIWVAIGFINCLLLVGPLAPIAVYLAIAGFAFDIPNAAIRAFIRIKTLLDLRRDYELLDNRQLLDSIDARIRFEAIQFGTHVLSTVAIFAAMVCAAPFLAANPIIPLVGAALLVTICILNFSREILLAKIKPKSMIEGVEYLSDKAELEQKKLNKFSHFSCCLFSSRKLKHKASAQHINLHEKKSF